MFCHLGFFIKNKICCTQKQIYAFNKHHITKLFKTEVSDVPEGVKKLQS